MTCDGRIGGSGFNFFNPITTGKTNKAANTGKTENVTTNIQITSTNSVERTDLSGTIADVSGRAQINSPAAQGLPSAEQVCNGQLVSGYHFDNLANIDTKLFTLRYNSANTPRIAEGTNYACEGVEYAEVASHLQTADSPFAELFS